MPSMSKWGDCHDNAVAENFFSILKTECICRQKSRHSNKTRELIDKFIYFYNHGHVQLKTGVAPLIQCYSA